MQEANATDMLSGLILLHYTLAYYTRTTREGGSMTGYNTRILTLVTRLVIPVNHLYITADEE